MSRLFETSSDNDYKALDYNVVGKVGLWAEKLQAIIEWMEEMGIPAGVSRYSRYYSYMIDFSTNPSKRIDPHRIITMNDLEEIFDKANKALIETAQIVMIYDAFKDECNCCFKDRLEKVVSGQDFYTNGVQDTGRDFLYELFIAAWFKSKGFRLDFEQLTDVVAEKNGISFFVECKRLRSSKKYEDRLKEGCQQLNKVENADFRLAFIDIYNCISDKIKVYEYRSISEIKSAMDRIVNSFISSVWPTTSQVLSKYSGQIDGVVYSAACNLYLNDTSANFYNGMNAHLYSEMSQKRFEQIIDMIR